MIMLGIPDWLDWEIVIVLAMAAAGVWIMVSEARSHRRDADERIALHSRIAAIETAINITNTHTIGERVAAIEGWCEAYDSGHRERLVALETRIELQPTTQPMRGPDGKFRGGTRRPNPNTPSDSCTSEGR